MKHFLHTHTSVQQHELEQTVSQIYADLVEFDEEDRQEMLLLLRDRHMRYLQVLLSENLASCSHKIPAHEHRPTYDATLSSS